MRTLPTPRFFQRTLAAARGDASSEQRSCSICLEEDLQEARIALQEAKLEAATLFD